MLRGISHSSRRAPLVLIRHRSYLAPVLTVRYTSSSGEKSPKGTLGSNTAIESPSTTPTSAATPTTNTGTKNTEPANSAGNNTHKDNTYKGNTREGTFARFALYGVLVAAAVATEEILEHWGVFSTRDFLRTKFGVGPFPEPATPVIRRPQEVRAVDSQPLPVMVATEETPTDAIATTTPPVETAQSPTVPPIEIPIEVTEKQPATEKQSVTEKQPTTEIIEIVQDTYHDEPLGAPPTPESVLAELFNEISDSTLDSTLPVAVEIQTPSVDLHALLASQGEQLEALRDRLQQYYAESNQALDYKAKAHEAAYREALEMRERVYRKELEEKLAQLQVELQAKHDNLRQKDRNEFQAHFQQLYEQQKTENDKKMEESLKIVVDNVEEKYNMRLVEEINKFDSKLVGALASEDAKFAESDAVRARALGQLRGEVTQLEAELNANSIKLRESLNLHNVSAALFELSAVSLSSPTKSSFKAELDKLSTASKALSSGSGDAVVSTVAEVLRPIAVEGIASFSELSERFKTVLASGRQAALVPEGGGVMGNLVAAVASKLIIPAKGPVSGDTPEAIFAKAEYYLERGELSEAVSQLSMLRGMPASVVRDWLQAASDRLIVENSLRALHAHVIVLAHQHTDARFQAFVN